MTSLRECLGCWANERWKTEWVLRQPRLARRMGMTWLDLCNRNERLLIDGVTGARLCDWADSSILTVGRVFPRVQERLFQYCFSLWPIALNFNHDRVTSPNPEASILIAVGGSERLPLLRMVLASLRGQVGVELEIIVVEQSDHADLEDQLPPDIRYLHRPNPVPDRGFNKSLALNQAADHARGAVLFIHDGDYVVPREYVKEGIRILNQKNGCRPARWLFYLEQDATQRAIAENQLMFPGIEKIVQNNPTPIAIRSDAYRRIGGHDESYFGWGGEDLEFLSRMRTGGRENGGTLPVVHLWHPPAPKKASGDRNREHHDQTMAVPAEQRIRQLHSERQERPRCQNLM
ncbi:glycosyltransferase family 2 protein [Stieleria mannarensis]|uniref:glycosyltransferase family 2 protein n=1 Tax=Stieleria mannarensis TaxID=2755585 RepID=UPI001601B006|nr:galactosyltransferase-related protein [Rhodopirellula sp. JC639]